MQFLLSLDYELFFGHQTGSAERCLVEPMEALCAVCRRFGVRLVLFVDAGYLWRLRIESTRHPALLKELKTVEGNLRKLAADGHEVQLHIHSHWEDSVFEDGAWLMNLERFRLQDFAAQEIAEIVRRYRDTLLEFATSPVTAYRAGGWCLQPFGKIANALADIGVHIDSTVFPGGRSEVPGREFDFRESPENLDSWQFNDDPTEPEPGGRFTEFPISSVQVSPTFFWRLAASKYLATNTLRTFGDGRAAGNSGRRNLRLLLTSSHSVASVDGLKADLLPTVYRQHARNNRAMLHVMGHPKALTRHSINRLETFLERHRDLRPVTFGDLSDQPGRTSALP